MDPVSKLANVAVLIVDDDTTIRLLIRDALKTLGFQNIHIASDGDSALKQMAKVKMDIVFCDWLMEPMDGIAFTKYVRAHLKNDMRTVPIIMLSGKASVNDVKYARDCGVTEYMIKPFSVQQICKRIHSVVEQPRDFVVTKTYTGPDRRRKLSDAPEERRKNNVKKRR